MCGEDLQRTAPAVWDKGAWWIGFSKAQGVVAVVGCAPALLDTPNNRTTAADPHLPPYFPLQCPQAVWYFCCARILHEGRPAWDSMQPAPDMGPAMYVPVVYVLWMNILSVTLLSGELSWRRKGLGLLQWDLKW